MRRLGKVFYSLLVGLSVLALSVSPAYGAAIARNVNITNSWAYVEATEDAEIIVDGFNLAEDVGWVVDVWANTGGNIVGGGGLIDTGPAGVLTDVETGVNSTSLWGWVDLGGTTLAENDTITDSWVLADASKTSSLEVNTDNFASWVGSIIGGYANSGENTALGGFSGDGGTIYTGAAGFGAISETQANDSFFDVFVDMSGNTTARNLDVTNSTAYANASSEVGVGVYTDNNAWMVGNIVNGYADSGSNEASGGDGLDGGNGGYIDTGLALFGSDTSTAVNSNETVLGVNLGGATKAENVGIDPSYVEANADSLAWVGVVNENGVFLVGNVIGGWFGPGAFANSGGNTANGGEGWIGYGGDGGVILSGDAGAAVFADTTANSNDTTVTGNIGGSTTARNAYVSDSPLWNGAYADADSAVGVLVVNDNAALGGNLVFVEANSGWNEANGGDGDWGGDGGYIDTGDAGVLIGSSVAMNNNYTLVGGDFGGNVTAENLYVDFSYADANASGGTFVEVSNLNDVSAVNSVEAYANTGWNTANGGSDGGEIYTGEAFLVTDVGTTVNSSTTVVAGAGGGNATASNTAVSNSYAEANASSTGSTGVINTNSASVETSVSTAANTGENDASGSSSGGIISTGSAVNETSVSTTVNTNDTTVAVEQGNARASNTGVTDSSATATAESSTTTTVTNTNDATVVNNVSTSSNTGGNTATDGGSVSTGGAGTGVSGSTSTNTNTVNLVVGP